MIGASLFCPGVIPVLVGPLQVIVTILPGILLAMLGGLVRIFSPSGFRAALRLVWRQKTAVTILAVVIAGGVYGYRNFMPRWRTDFSGAETEKGSDWTRARGDLLRTGAVPGSPSPTSFKMVWNFRQGRFGFTASPAVVGNRVYISAWDSTFGSAKGQIFCLDADTGAVVWANSPDNYRQTFSSPVIAGDYLVCGEGEHKTPDARIVCLDIRPSEKGKVLWTFATKNHVECTPVIYKDRVYVGAGDDGIYCLDLKPGPDGKAKLNWHLPNEDFKDCETSLAVHDDRVYFGLGFGGEAMCVIDAGTGKELKRIAMPHPVFSPATIDVKNGQIYFGMGTGDYAEFKGGGAVQCLKLDTLETLWKFDLDKPVLGVVAVKDDMLYFGGGDGFLYCLSKEGRLIRKFNARSPLKTSPAVTDTAIYIVSEKGFLIGLDRKTFEPMWEYRLGGDQYFVSSPVVARGRVYVGTEKDGFFCIGEPVERPYWPNPLGGLNKAGNVDDSLVTGLLVKAAPDANEDDPLVAVLPIQWTYPAPADRLPHVRCLASPAIWKDDLFIPMTMGSVTGLACLRRKVDEGTAARFSASLVGINAMPSGGRGGVVDAWSEPAPKQRWFFETGSEISQAPVVLDQFVLATVSGVSNKERGRLLCLHRDSGSPAWEVPITDSGVLTVTPAQAAPRETRDRLQILVQDTKDHLTSLDREGKIVWSRPIGPFGNDPADPLRGPLYPMAVGNIIVAATWASAAELNLQGKPALVALDRGTGAILWKVALDYRPLTSPHATKKVIYLGTPTGLEARSLLDGKELPGWDCQAGAPSAEFAVGERSIFYVTRAGDMVVVHREDGSVKGKEHGARRGFPPLPMQNEKAMVVTDFGLAQAEITSAGALRLFALDDTRESDVGKLAAPMVLCESRLYLPTVNRGLVCIGGK